MSDDTEKQVCEQRILERIEQFRSTIRTSRRLAADAEKFCSDLVGMIDGDPAVLSAWEDELEAREAEVLRIVELILTDPDAVLRRRLEALRELLGTTPRKPVTCVSFMTRSLLV